MRSREVYRQKLKYITLNHQGYIRVPVGLEVIADIWPKNSS